MSKELIKSKILASMDTFVNKVLEIEENAQRELDDINNQKAKLREAEKELKAQIEESKKRGEATQENLKGLIEDYQKRIKELEIKTMELQKSNIEAKEVKDKADELLRSAEAEKSMTSIALDKAKQAFVEAETERKKALEKHSEIKKTRIEFDDRERLLVNRETKVFKKEQGLSEKEKDLSEREITLTAREKEVNRLIKRYNLEQSIKGV